MPERRPETTRKKKPTYLSTCDVHDSKDSPWVPPIASCRPILPKHTHAQKRTLATQVRRATPSCVIPVTNPYSSPVPFGPRNVVALSADEGISSGLSPKMIPIPANPTVVDNQNPVLVRSIRYHNTGFARASVNEACVVDSHGSRRYKANGQRTQKHKKSEKCLKLTIAKAIPTKAPTLRTAATKVGV